MRIQEKVLDFVEDCEQEYDGMDDVFVYMKDELRQQLREK